MKVKKLILSTFMIFTLASLLLINVNSVQATDLGSNAFKVKASVLRDTYGYSLEKHGSIAGTRNAVQSIIWNLNALNSDETTIDTKKNLYCVKATVGFTSTSTAYTYNRSWNVKTEREAINTALNYTGSTNDYYLNTIVGKDYEKILWILDNMYVPDSETASEEKEALLASAGIRSDLRDEVVEAVQQVALWYFTNYGEKYVYTGVTPSEGETFYNKFYDEDDWAELLYYATEDNQNADFSALSDLSETESEKSWKLYRYLIDSSLKASKYSDQTKNNYVYTQDETSKEYKINAPYSIGEETPAVRKIDDRNYMVGPLSISKNHNLYSKLAIVDEDGKMIDESNLTFYDEEGKPVTTKTIKATAEKYSKFYITVKDIKPSKLVEQYSVSEVILYTNGTSATSTQPIIDVHKKLVKSEVPFEEVRNKVFDLSLRKYITKINGTELNKANTRVPNITNTSTLVEEETTTTTATYNHRKAPIAVNTGDVVTYSITVYNEGEEAGRVIEIKDQLPTGIKFSKVVTEGYTGTCDENNLLTITNTKENNLAGYTGTGNLASETVEIECTVEEEADKEDTIILTNVAWISKEYNADKKETILAEEGKDRDSEPATEPTTKKANDLRTINEIGYIGNTSNSGLDLESSESYFKGMQDDDDFEKVRILPIPEEKADLKLIKYITAVNETPVANRIRSIDTSNLNKYVDGELVTTAKYDLDKTPVNVKKGDYVTYTFRIYNEGNIDAYASEITEDIPAGLEFIYSKLGDKYEEDDTLTEEDKKAIEYNANYGWAFADTTLKTVSTNYLSRKVETIEGNGENLIPAYDEEKDDGKGAGLSHNKKELSIMLKVISENTSGTVIRNEAAITEDTDKDGNDVTDRDSDPEKWVKYEDDEDYDNIILKSFDLSLRKFITKVNDKEVKESREPKVDVSKLGTFDKDEKLITTAEYNHTKEPLVVSIGDEVIYTIRVYNEGEISGMAGQVIDYLPEYLEFIEEDDLNKEYGWELSEEGRKVTTTYLADKEISGFDKETMETLDYEDLQIKCKVKKGAKTHENITNIAEISEYLNEDGKEINPDRDSTSNNVKIPEDEKLPEYKDEEIKSGESYIPGQEDDDDFEKIVINEFDLALRKFITEVSGKPVNTRIPSVTYKDEKLVYTHTKEPLEVVAGDTVVYTIRVYNEGEVNGYAKEISDNIPEYLEYLPNNAINKVYGWEISEDGTKITTKYLSKENEKEEGENLLKAFDTKAEISDSNPDNKEVKVAFKVKDPGSSSYIITNKAQISEDTDENGNPVDDIDSVPDEWNEGEDDQDVEHVKVQYFDLALLKYVSKTIVIEDGKQTVTETGYNGLEDPEPIVKVDLHRKNLNKTTVKFGYTIKITNEGDIAGYAKEITDYVPEGLEFRAEDNKGWEDKGNNVITTNLLSDTLLQPGESATVEVIFTWKNSTTNLGLKTNIAEISKDENEKGVPDRDSTPNNRIKGEDDQDEALVMLSISTGAEKTYFLLIGSLLITMATGIVLIKKYVL